MLKTKGKKPLFKRGSDNYASKLKRRKLINYLRGELRNSTTHGLPYLVNKKIHWLERLFWTANFLSCTGLVFVLLSAQYGRFIDTPIVISVEMDYLNWNVSYPAYTLCPHFKPDRVIHHMIVNETSQRAGRNLESYVWGIVSAGMETVSLYDLQLQHPEILPFIDPRNYTTMSARAFKKFDSSSVTTNTNCPVSIEPVMTELGMCHTINSNVAKFDNPDNWNKSKLTYSKDNIVLSVHDREFYSQVMDYADVYRVFIHSPDEIILSTSPSYITNYRGFLSFGVQIWSTKISDTLRDTPIRLRKCRFVHEPMNKRYPVYSYNHCILECRIKMIVRLCGCIPHFYKPLDHERICYLSELNCINDYKKEILSLATTNATLRKFHNAKDLPRSPRDCACLNSCETDVYHKDFETFRGQSTVNRLKIDISNFPKVRVLRDIIFSFEDIILKVGGVVNLCIGTSLISLMEFVLNVIKIPIKLFKPEW